MDRPLELSGQHLVSHTRAHTHACLPRRTHANTHTHKHHTKPEYFCQVNEEWKGILTFAFSDIFSLCLGDGAPGLFNKWREPRDHWWAGCAAVITWTFNDVLLIFLQIEFAHPHSIPRPPLFFFFFAVGDRVSTRTHCPPASVSQMFEDYNWETPCPESLKSKFELKIGNICNDVCQSIYFYELVKFIIHGENAFPFNYVKVVPSQSMKNIGFV